jgi:hypothetical protein
VYSRCSSFVRSYETHSGKYLPLFHTTAPEKKIWIVAIHMQANRWKNRHMSTLSMLKKHAHRLAVMAWSILFQFKSISVNLSLQPSNSSIVAISVDTSRMCVSVYVVATAAQRSCQIKLANNRFCYKLSSLRQLHRTKKRRHRLKSSNLSTCK